MHHTILPDQLVWDDPANRVTSQPLCVHWHGAVVETAGDPLHPTVGRLLSTDPRLFLDPHFSPGQPLPPVFPR
ncbi:MAG: YlzJ-like family protein [Eubacteriales bacterium]|jgi:hypothetical protein